MEDLSKSILLGVGKAAGAIIAAATIGGTLGLSCVTGIYWGVLNIQRVERKTSAHVETVGEIIEKARAVKESATEEPTKKQSAPTASPTLPKRSTGPTMTAHEEPRTFADEPIRYRSYTYKKDVAPLTISDEITEEQRAQLKKYLDRQAESIERGRNEQR